MFYLSIMDCSAVTFLSCTEKLYKEKIYLIEEACESVGVVTKTSAACRLSVGAGYKPFVAYITAAVAVCVNMSKGGNYH